LLDEITAWAAAGAENIHGAVALEVELGADVVALEDHEWYAEADVVSEEESDARGVDWRVVLELRILSETVVGLAEGDARAAASHQAGINRIEELDKAVLPWLFAYEASDGIWLVGSILETIDPVANIIFMDRSSDWGSLLSGRSVHGHCDMYIESVGIFGLK